MVLFVFQVYPKKKEIKVHLEKAKAGKWKFTFDQMR